MRPVGIEDRNFGPMGYRRPGVHPAHKKTRPEAGSNNMIVDGKGTSDQALAGRLRIARLLRVAIGPRCRLPIGPVRQLPIARRLRVPDRCAPGRTR